MEYNKNLIRIANRIQDTLTKLRNNHYAEVLNRIEKLLDKMEELQVKSKLMRESLTRGWNSSAEEYTPTHCQDRKLANLRWIHRRLFQQLGRREPEGRPEYQLLRRIPRRGCDTPMPGETADYYKTQNTGQDHISPRPPFDSPADKPPQLLPFATIVQ